MGGVEGSPDGTGRRRTGSARRAARSSGGESSLTGPSSGESDCDARARRRTGGSPAFPENAAGGTAGTGGSAGALLSHLSSAIPLAPSIAAGDMWTPSVSREIEATYTRSRKCCFLCHARSRPGHPRICSVPAEKGVGRRPEPGLGRAFGLTRGPAMTHGSTLPSPGIIPSFELADVRPSWHCEGRSTPGKKQGLPLPLREGPGRGRNETRRFDPSPQPPPARGGGASALSAAVSSSRGSAAGRWSTRNDSLAVRQ